MRILSRPAWGAWIEMVSVTASTGAVKQSRPAWGAWIEMPEPCSRNFFRWSRPAWGAWIEIYQSPLSGTIQ